MLLQVLAINRGESLKILKVSVDIPDAVKDNFVSRCVSRYQPRSADGPLKQLVVRSASDGYDRLVQPMLTRGFRFLSQNVLAFFVDLCISFKYPV